MRFRKFDDTCPPGGESGSFISPVQAILGIVLLTSLGKIAINPVLAPLARETGLQAWQVGATVSGAALLIALSSQWWGRRSVAIGYKRVLTLSLWLTLLALSLFTMVAQFGMWGWFAPAWLFVSFFVLRGVLYGWSMAAIPPTAQAYITDITTTESERVRGMAGIGAAQSIATVGGAVLGGILAIFGLLAPLVAAPLLVVASLLLLLALPRAPRRTVRTMAPRMSMFDKRVFPYLVVGFFMFTAVCFPQIILGFIIGDRFNLGVSQTALWTGVALLAAGVGALFAQLVLIRHLTWGPHRLLRVGLLVLFVGIVLLIPHLNMWVVSLSMFVQGVGTGLAVPGYSAAPTMLVKDSEQGALAGLLWGNNALSYVVTPTVAGMFYGWHHDVPTVVSALILVLPLGMMFLHPRLAQR
ncbi:MFS transporter [Actinomycetaceae bacterium TAE3-ERU4]|nr:MFS transporter [Actinomycetaceae bacterium TAE3-ERU4]